jgi:hypothetical protein
MTHRTLAVLIAAPVAIFALLQVQASESDLSTTARLAEVQVNLMSVVPGAPTGGGDWCIGTDPVTLTAIVVNPSTQSEVTEGTIVWQVCAGEVSPDSRGFPRGLPKEACVAHGPGRWLGTVLSFLDFDSTPSIEFEPIVPVLGFRMQFRPVSGNSGLARAASAPFNLDTTCSP